MTTIAKRYQFPPGMAAQVLKSMFVHATPGQWDARASWVVANLPPAADVKMGPESQENHDYYGGQLVAESCSRADAALIAAMIAMLPSVCDAYLDAMREVERLTMQLRLVQEESEELNRFIEFIRSERYQRPAFAVARRLELDEMRRRELEQEIGPR